MYQNNLLSNTPSQSQLSSDLFKSLNVATTSKDQGLVAKDGLHDMPQGEGSSDLCILSLDPHYEINQDIEMRQSEKSDYYITKQFQKEADTPTIINLKVQKVIGLTGPQSDKKSLFLGLSSQKVCVEDDEAPNKLE